MGIYCGNSSTGSVKDALAKLKDPKFIIMFVAEPDTFESRVKELEEAAPGVESLACVAQSYSDVFYPKGITLISFDPSDTEIRSGIIHEAATAPARYMHKLEQNISDIHPGKDNTVCITFCTGQDAKVITTMQPALKKHNICETGGTVDQAKISYCGRVYEDSAVYLIVKNLKGKVKTYKENLYKSEREERFIASDTDISKYYVGKLNGKNAKDTYRDTLGIKDSDIETQTFENPLGKMVGDECYIVSLKSVCGSGLTCYKQVNDSDILSILDIQDTKQVVSQTTESINSDFRNIDCVFSVNCIFRYLYLSGKNEFGDYLSMMSELGDHYGYVGFGEHLDCTFVNQTMSCVVFGN